MLFQLIRTVTKVQVLTVIANALSNFFVFIVRFILFLERIGRKLKSVNANTSAFFFLCRNLNSYGNILSIENFQNF